MKSLLNKVNAKLNAQGGFIKAVSILVGGTAFAQLLALIALPFLTRLYSPADFSIFAIYTSILGILTVASCLRLEIAIPISQDDSEAVDLVVLALLSNFIISILITLIIIIFNKEIIMLLNQPDFSRLLWLIPIGVFFSGVYNTLQYWSTRKKNFKVIAKTRLVQSVSGVSTQIGMGALGFSAIGLVVGQIIKVSAGFYELGKKCWGDIKENIKNISLKKLSITLKKNDNFVKYSTLDSLANTLGIQLPIIIIASISLGSEVGYLMIAMQIMAIPIQLLGGAISQVYLAHAPEAVQKGEIREYTFKILESLFKYGFSVLIFIGLLSPLLAKYIFGFQWEKVGLIISWMVPWFAFQLVSSPISMIMHIVGKQKQMLVLTIFGLILRIGILYGQFYINPQYIIEAYAISGAIFYMICYLLFTFEAKLRINDHLSLIRKSIFFIMGIIIFGFIVNYTLKVIGL